MTTTIAETYNFFSVTRARKKIGLEAVTEAFTLGIGGTTVGFLGVSILTGLDYDGYTDDASSFVEKLSNAKYLKKIDFDFSDAKVKRKENKYGYLKYMDKTDSRYRCIVYAQRLGAVLGSEYVYGRLCLNTRHREVENLDQHLFEFIENLRTDGSGKQLTALRGEGSKKRPPSKTAPATPPTMSIKGMKKPVDVFRDCPKCPEMVVIPSGSFRMGDLNGDGENNEKPVRMVTIRYSFAVGKYEVTQAEWEAVMGSNPSGFKANDRPVEQVSWDDVQKFIRKLNAKTGQDYRLLSEAEWEYVARAGTTSKYPWGNSASHEYANFSRGVFSTGFESGRDRWVKTAPIGSFAPNDYGVHDMHGNVIEWTADCWHDNYIGASRDGSAWISGENCSERVLRGGSWTNYLPRNQRSAYRFSFRTDFQSNDIGFRIAKTLF